MKTTIAILITLSLASCGTAPVSWQREGARAEKHESINFQSRQYCADCGKRGPYPGPHGKKGRK